MPSSIKKEYVCHKCGFHTNVIENFNNHSCGCLECKKCDIIFNSEAELINHVCMNSFALKHLESEKTKNIYICLKCNLICKSNGALKLHNNIHFKGQFKCLHCDFATNFENLLKMHIKNCDGMPAFSFTNNEETEKYTPSECDTWSHKEMLEIYWCDIYARGLSPGKPQGNVGRRRRKMLIERGNIDLTKLRSTSDRSFYTVISKIRSGRTTITKRELANMVDDVRKFLKNQGMASKWDEASDESEDEIPLANIKSDDDVNPEPAFQEMMPMSNNAFVKRSRRKTINYKEQSSTKDLLKEKYIKKEKTDTKKQETPKKNKETNRAPKERWFCHGCSKEKVADMIRCIRCRKWYHEMCVGLSQEDIDEFICPDGCS